MKTVACILVALVAVAAGRELQQLNCKAESEATLDLTGSGSGVAQSQAFCQAEADARSSIESTVSEYIVKLSEGDAAGQCTEAAASEAVTGVAEAIATVYASVTTKVEIEGTGEACAEGFAAGDALAISVVDILLDLSVQLIEDNFPDLGYGEQVVKVATGKENEATGAAAGRAVAVVIADAWAAVTGGACTTGGFANDFQDVLVDSVSTAIAELWATIVVELCSNFDAADKDGLKEWAERTSSSFSEIAGDIEVLNKTTTDASEDAVASGTSGEVPPCTGAKAQCCDVPYATKSCDCGDGCSMTVQSEIGLTGLRTWVDGADAFCFCRADDGR